MELRCMSRAFMGKYLEKNASVALARSHGEEYILFRFNSMSEAKEYYESIDFSSKKMFLQRMKIALCKHEEEYELDVESKIYHYLYCPKCCRAIYVDHETEEHRKEREKKFEESYIKHRIRELEENIKHRETELQIMESELEEKKKELNNNSN